MFLRYFTVIKSQPEGEQFYFRLFDIIGESVTGAFSINADFGSQVVFGHVVEPIKDPIFYLANDIFNGDAGALIAKIGTPLVPSPGGVKRAVVGQDFKGDHLQLMEDIDQNMEDLIIAGGAYPASEIGKSRLTGDIVGGDACKPAVRSAAVLIAEYGTEAAHLLVTIDESEQVQQKQTRRVVAGW